MTELPTNNKFTRFNRYYRSIGPVLEKPKNRVYTAIIFSFLAISLFGWYAIRPTIQTILYLRREIADKTEINAKMEAKIASLIEAQSSYQDIQDRLPLINEAIPQTPEAVDLALQLRNVVGTTEATYSSIVVSSAPFTSEKPKETTKKSNTENAFDLTVVSEGDYINLEMIINELATMRRLVDLKSIDISSGSEYFSSPESTESAIANYLKMSSYLTSFYNP
jgi:hypothetical protein